MIIESWHSEKLKQILSVIEPPDFSHLEYDDVEAYACDGCHVVANPGVDTHHDQMFPKYSVMLVHYNNGLIAKGTRQSRVKLEPQKPGTIIILDVHAWHHCIDDNRVKTNDKRMWIAYYFEYEKKEDIPDKQVIEDKFISFLIDDFPEFDKIRSKKLISNFCS